MKTKMLSKKLNLNKITILDLNQDDMKAVQGGETAEPVYTCGTCLTACGVTYCQIGCTNTPCIY